MKKLSTLLAVMLIAFSFGAKAQTNVVSSCYGNGITGTNSEANKWGWASTYASAGWGQANGAGIRFRDLSNIAVSTGGTYTGREFLYRWDGSYLGSTLGLGIGDGTTTTVSGIKLVGGVSYTFSGYNEWVNNANAPTYTYVYSTALSAGTQVALGTSAAAVKNTYYPFSFTFTPAADGVYYFQVTQTAGLSSGAGGLIGIAKLSLIANSSAASIDKASFEFIPTSTSGTENVYAIGLTADLVLTPPAGISLSGTNVVNNGDGTYNILQANADNKTNTVTVTWDGTTTVNGNITISSNASTLKSIAVTGSSAPGIVISAPLTFNVTTNSGTFDVTGSSLTQDISLTAPSGVTLSGTNVTGTAPNYTIALANANTLNSITATWDKINNLNSSISISSTSVTKSVTVSSTDDVEASALTSLIPSTGLLSPAFDPATLTYTVKAPADVTSVTLTGATTSLRTIENNGATVSDGTPATITGRSYNTLNTTNYTTTWGGNFIFGDWAANGATGSASLPTIYGWSANPTITWVNANATTTGTVRYMDFVNGANAGVSGVTYTYNTSNYTGRVLFVRWDGSASRIYSYPVLLEQGSYSFSGKSAWNSVATAGTLTFNINSAKDNTGTSCATATAATTTAGTLVDVLDGTSNTTTTVTVPATGVYYLNIASSTASLCAVADLSLVKNIATEVKQPEVSGTIYIANIAGQLSVYGTRVGDVVNVYNTNGSLVNKTVATTDVTPLKVGTGVYIVKVNGSILKAVN
jgi:hypothetical protein